MLVTLKRTAVATQKEVRKKALKAQRRNSTPQIQVKCKRLGKDITTFAPTLEAASERRRIEVEQQADRKQWLDNGGMGMEEGAALALAPPPTTTTAAAAAGSASGGATRGGVARGGGVGGGGVGGGGVGGGGVGGGEGAAGEGAKRAAWRGQPNDVAMHYVQVRLSLQGV